MYQKHKRKQVVDALNHDYYDKLKVENTFMIIRVE